MGSNPHYAYMLHLRRLKNGEAEGSGAVNTLILLDTYVKFGRSETCDVVLTSTIGVKNSNSNTNMISREHAHINGIKSSTGRIEKYLLTDHSLNGTYVNDYRCQSKRPVEIKEGDIIKFGHMNGASVKEGAHAPQANAEFAFMVERANPNLNYLGFRDGRRYLPLTCKGEHDYCEEVDTLKKLATSMSGVPPSLQNQTPGLQLPTTTSAATAQQAASVMNLFPGIYPFGLNGFTAAGAIYQQQLLQGLPQATSGFRAPNIFGMSPFPSLPATSNSSLLTRNLIQNNQQFMNQLLTTGSVSPMVGAESLLTTAASSVLLNTARLAEETKAAQDQKESKPAVASPPMECDSSVPSPPKTASVTTSTPQFPSLISPKKEDDIRSEISYADSSPPRRTMAAPAPWECTPSPRPRDTPDTLSIKDSDERREREKDTDTESRPEEVKKQPATSTSSSHKHKKNNEIARLLEDITETSFANQLRRTSTSRRPTEDERLEKQAKKEKKKKERAQLERMRGDAPSSSSSATMRRMKQLSDEDSATSDSDTEPVPLKKDVLKKKRARSSDDDSDSDDSGKRKRKRIKNKKPSIPKKIPSLKKDQKSTWKKEEAMSSSSESTEAPAQPMVYDNNTPCELKGRCRKPQDENLEWVACDDCDQWFHNVCVFGSNDPYKSATFSCGCAREENEDEEVKRRMKNVKKKRSKK